MGFSIPDQSVAPWRVRHEKTLLAAGLLTIATPALAETPVLHRADL
jgi:hypothetical protein